MRPARILIPLTVAFAALSAVAVSMVTQLDSHNIYHQRLSFTIKANKNVAQNEHFIITVEPKEATLSPFLRAHLAVVDGTNQIVSCAVENAHRDKGVVYEFEVSLRYLAKSTFSFGNMAELNGQPMPAGDFYWFYLKDFVSEK
jgi:hypothetical protein